MRYCRCSLGEKCRSYNAELMRTQQLTYDADSLRAELSAVKQSHDQLAADLSQAHQLLRERTESLMNYFDQSVDVEVCACVIVTKKNAESFYIVLFVFDKDVKGSDISSLGSLLVIEQKMSFSGCWRHLTSKSLHILYIGMYFPSTPLLSLPSLLIIVSEKDMVGWC